MQYTELGKTGVKVSRLGFGTMRLPMSGEDINRAEAIPMLRRAARMGVNYFDTAAGYGNGQCEAVLGEALRDLHGRVYISTKNPVWNHASPEIWRRSLDRSLHRLGIDCIDFYCVVHGMDWQAYTEKYDVPGGFGQEARKAYDEGLFKHCCISFHDTPQNLIKLIDTGEFEVVTLQYNLLDRSNEDAIAYAHSKGVGVVVMGPVAGGRLMHPSEKLMRAVPGVSSTPELSIRFVLSNPHVSLALSGMGSMQMLEENVASASCEQPMTNEEYGCVLKLAEELKRLADLYCTGCNYCMPCPNGVDIPANFTAMNMDRVYGLRKLAVERYDELHKPEKNEDRRASVCVECGRCELRCPQHIPIIKQLKETAAAMEERKA
ncbi:MAG: aldo/keto reductase [bacterium]|jgi:predicted aldo/keto reductase-like oxidoreductase|nr:aldo/keto reductase [bacterium]